MKLNAKLIERLYKDAKSILEVRPCDDTIDGKGVAVLVDGPGGHATYPAYTRDEFIKLFKQQNKIIIMLIELLEDKALAEMAKEAEKDESVEFEFPR